MKPLLSVSRRTDIPAFYGDWWLRCLRQGSCRVPNPVTGQFQTLSLDPGHWAGVVFWTRNAGPFLPHINEVDRHFGGRVAWQFSLTGMPRVLEPRNPPLEAALGQLRSLAERYGSHSVSWRFDPIVLTRDWTAAQVLARFDELAARLEGRLTRCITSFADDYARVGRNLADLQRRQGVFVHWPGLKERRELALKLAERAALHGLELQACCESDLLDLPGITAARCLDVNQLAVRPLGRPPREQPTREGCHCHTSRDPGFYDSCPHGCTYCYANRNPEQPRLFNAAYRRSGLRMPGEEDAGADCRAEGKP
jgi:hypothetical protein